MINSPVLGEIDYAQSEMIAGQVANYIADKDCGSLLDIGAGGGVLAQRLAAMSRSYLAIEHDRSRCLALQEARLKVIQATFPLKLRRQFNLVVASHSLPNSPDDWPRFLDCATDAVAEEGALLLVTFIGGLGTIRSIRSELYRSGDDHSDYYDTLINLLQARGRLKVWRAASSIRSTHVEPMIVFLRSWFAGTFNKDDLERLLNCKFKMAVGYCVPTEHTFMACSPSRR